MGGDGNKRKIFSEEITHTLDYTSGKITSSSRQNVMSVARTPDFVMAFTNDLGYLANISGGASKLLFGLLTYLDRNNEVALNKARKDEIAKKIGVNTTSIQPFLSQLLKAEVILRKNDDSGAPLQGVFTLNPYYFGKGQWKNVSKLRMMIEYDFNAGTKRVLSETEYNEVDDNDFIEQMLQNKDEIMQYLELKKQQGDVPAITLNTAG